MLPVGLVGGASGGEFLEIHGGDEVCDRWFAGRDTDMQSGQCEPHFLVGAVRLGLPHLTSLCGGLFAGREDADRHDDLGLIGFAWLVVTGQDWR